MDDPIYVKIYPWKKLNGERRESEALCLLPLDVGGN